jgi:hypothetical protein
MDSYVPFTNSSSHNSGLISIFFRSAHACPWSPVFLFVLRNVPRRLSRIFFSTYITSIKWWASKSFQYGSSQKNRLLLRLVIFFNILVSHFSLTKDNMDILNYFIDFMTCDMRCRMPLLGLTIELILRNLKLVFHWNVASMSHIHHFLWLA